MQNFLTEYKWTIYIFFIIYGLMVAICIYQTAKNDKEEYGGKWFSQIAVEFKNDPVLTLFRYLFGPFVK